MTKTIDRRAFLRGCIGMALGSAGMGWLSLPTPAEAAGAGEYKALVCVYLAGGNDSFNMVVPMGAAYEDYAEARPALAIDRNRLEPLGASGYGLHPKAKALSPLFRNGHLAVVANCGNLIRPVTAQAYRDGTVALPPQLFSHSDQRRLWMAGGARGDTIDGWAGRLADWLVDSGVPAAPAINFNLGGINLLQDGQRSGQFSLTRQGKGYVTLHGSRDREGKRSFSIYRELAERSRASSHPLVSEYARVQIDSLIQAEKIRSALDAAPPLTTRFTTTPDQMFGRDLEVVAQMIAARRGLGARRQIFFVRLGGWDTHANQLADHSVLLETLATGLVEFDQALEELGVKDQVTTFTASEFGRSLSANGDGTDHGWGGHHLVLGGAVAGGRIYGKMPEWKIGGPDDAGKGRLIPTTSNDQFNATLARWFGLDEAALDGVFPNLQHFVERDLGFLPA